METYTFLTARVGAIINADKIVVLDNGRIIESGAPEQFLARRGRYYVLYTMQWAQQPTFSANYTAWTNRQSRPRCRLEIATSAAIGLLRNE